MDQRRTDHALDIGTRAPMSEIPLVSETPFALEGAATRTRRACLFLTTNGAEPCGVEIFTRKLVAALAAGAPDAGCELMPISGSWRDLPATMLRIARAHKVVFSADRKSTRLNSSHQIISYAVFCLKKKKQIFV